MSEWAIVDALRRENAALKARVALLEEAAKLPGELHASDRDLLLSVARECGVTAHEIYSEGRSKSAVHARRRAAIALRERGKSYTEIGAILKRDHTTVRALILNGERGRR